MKSKETLGKKKNVVKKSNLATKQISIFTILFAVIAVAVIIAIIYGIRMLWITLQYRKYAIKMDSYGLSTLYTNKKATSINDVTNIEMLKVVISGVRSDLKPSTFKTELTDEEWIKLSDELGLNYGVNKDNMKDTVTKSQSVIFVANAVINLLQLDVESTKLNMSESTLNRFTEDSKSVIGKAVTMGLINNKNSEVANSKLIKGELNKLVVTVMEKYSTIYYGVLDNSQNEQIASKVNIVTDKKGMPTNYKEYPYIINTIPKEVYEYSVNKNVTKDYQNPAKVYESMGYLYGQVDEQLTRYLNNILNVNYEEINEKSFLEAIENETVYYADETKIKEYVDYVKDNKIKIEGTATPLLPIIYFDGNQYLVRAKINFKIVNSDTNINLLYGDSRKVVYTGEQFEIYVDVPMGMTFNSNSLRVYEGTLAQTIVSNNSNILIEK